MIDKPIHLVVRGFVRALPGGRGRVGAGRWCAFLFVGSVLWGAGCSAGVGARGAELGRMVGLLSAASMEGRGAGTAGLAAARDYLRGQAEAAGLAGAFAHRGRCGGDPYLQAFELGLGVEVRKQALRVDSVGGAGLSLVGGDDFSVLGFSGDGAFEGPVVFVGYGIVDQERGYDSYAGLKSEGLGVGVGGRVAVAFRYEPMDSKGRSRWMKSGGRWTRAASLTDKARWAADRGASALVVVNPPSVDRGELKKTRLSPGMAAAPIPVLHIRASVFERMLRMAGREGIDVVKELQRAADEGRLVAAELEGVSVAGEVALERRRGVVSNVAGYVRGRGALADEVVVVGAHYDHLGFGEVGSLSGEHAIHPGADDNASGTAAVVAVAREYAARVGGRGDDAVARRTVLFVWFAGEERGLLGSAEFVERLSGLALGGKAKIVAMVNLDMIGRMREGKVHVSGANTAERWAVILKEAGRRAGVSVATEGRAFGGSDHAVFQNLGVPAVHLFTGVHEDYHRPSDTPDKINALGLAKVVRMVGLIVDRLATDGRGLAFVEGSVNAGVHGAGGPGGTRAYFGIMPDYSGGGEHSGCGVGGVSPGGPAGEAGIVRGDLIVGWDGQEVKDVYDLSRILGGHEPGDVVRVEVLRGSDVIEIVVELGSR